MSSLFLSTGSNMGNRAANLRKAAAFCNNRIGKLLHSSGLYETEAWGNTDQSPFLNQVLELETSLSPMEVLEGIIEMEKALGRVRKEKWGPRPIDIDILFYDQLVLNEPGLHIPHPQLAFRRFVLVPLVEIAPGLVHPENGLTAKKLLAQCPDTLKVMPFIPDPLTET